jgi:putative transposase
MAINYWEKFEGDAFYHVYNRGINGCNLFYTAENYRYFLAKWAKYLHPFLRVYAYCLMPNHFHFVVQPNTAFFEGIDTLDIGAVFPNRAVLQKRLRQIKQGEWTVNEFLEWQMKDLFSSYSKAIAQQEKRTGSLFQQRFKRLRLRTREK